MRLNIFLFIVLNLIFFPPVFARDYQPVNQMARPGKALTRSVEATAGNTRNQQQGGAIKLFGTVEFQRPLDSLPAWIDVLQRNKADGIFTSGKRFNKATGWDQLRTNVNGKSPMEQLRIINSFWNGWPYKEDIVNWGKEDYWAIPAQFLKKSGDCEDYAIIKYFTLKEIGFDPHKMRIVVLRDTIRRLAHAVLVVYIDGDAYVLDNLSNAVLSHRRLGNYAPQYSVNEYGRWTHIKPKK